MEPSSNQTNTAPAGPVPHEGGSYTRDPKTGELIKVEDDEAVTVAPAPTPAPATIAPIAAVKPITPPDATPAV